ncbi:MAG: ACT domain-containing protein [Corynebacterium sp.]|nr:ACT domain-containing protein [Corynebacterium sp.]
MIAIITVTGKDHTGIIAAVTSALATLNVNILNLSQSILDTYFTMFLHCEFDDTKLDISTVQDAMNKVGEEQALSIRVQSEDIFTAMHRL